MDRTRLLAFRSFVRQCRERGRPGLVSVGVFFAPEIFIDIVPGLQKGQAYITACTADSTAQHY